MYLGRKSSFYRPYHISVNNKDYYINNILIYDDNGIIVSEGCCFKDKNGSDINHVEIPVEEIKLKRKEDFLIKTGFVMYHKDYFNTSINLYLHKNLINLKEVGLEKKYNTIYVIYEGNIDGQDLGFSSSLTYLDSESNTLRIDLENKIKALGSLYSKERETFDKELKEIKSFSKKYFDELDKVANYTVDDYIKETNYKEHDIEKMEMSM